MAGIKDYSTTQANNTDLNGISTAEGMLPSNLNNAIRALMKNTREWYNDSQWVEYGDGDAAFTAAYVSSTSFTIAGVNVTAIYHAGRRIKLTASTPGTIYGTISSSTFSTNTTVNVTWDSGSLSSEAITNVYIGALSKTNNSIPTGIISTAILADGSVTTAKIADSQITVAKMTSNSVDSDQYVDGSIDTAHIADSNITVAKMAANSVDSDQYVDGSIDTIHIGDDQITTAKIPDSAITSAKILDGAIVNADINASAAIALSKLENLTTARALVSDGSGDVSVSAVTSTEIGYLDGVSSAIQTQIDAKQASDADLTAIGALAKTDGNLIVGNGSTWVAESGATARTSLGLGTISTQASDNVSLTGGSITGLGEPSANSDASTKSYVDQAVAGLRTRTIAECASTANVVISSALEAGDAIDGVTLVAGDRVLLKDQSTATENGLYIAVGSGAGAASRDPEHDTIAELSGGMVVVNQGTANDNKIFLCTTDSDGSLGSTSITYTVVTPSNSGTVTSITAGTGLSGGTITSAGTIAIDTATTVDKTTAQTLTNKTLTSPKINEDVALTSTATELNLLDGVSGLVQADFTKLAAVSSTADELNLLDGVSGLVQADFTKLAAIDSTATELNTLDGLSRGSIIYGNASAATTVLTKGTANQVLTSDGTDISWSAVDSGIAWQSSIVTASTLTAVAGRGYWIDTTSNACTITLPSSASVGDQIIFTDYLRTWETNAVTINPNSLKFQGNTSPNPVYDTTGQSVDLVYSGATNGWIPNSDDDVINETPQPYSADFLVVAGGGAGGNWTGGGGGAGGYRTSTQNIAAGISYTITVGDGGASKSGESPSAGNDGSNSSISGSDITDITSTGGGGGGGYEPGDSGAGPGRNGGSGGGGGGQSSQSGGSGNTPSTSPSQGNAGGTSNSTSYNLGGGGGASAVGGNGTTTAGGNGGAGTASSITGSSVTYAGGGGGHSDKTSAGTGGAGGGGAAGLNAPSDGTDGTANLGGGGGGSRDSGTSGAGGKGVVILSMPDANYSGTTTGSPTVATGVSGKTVLTFTGSGSYTG